MTATALRDFGREAHPINRFMNFKAVWQNGYVLACKAIHLGSIPGAASNLTSTVYVVDRPSVGSNYQTRVLLVRYFRHAEHPSV